MFAVIIVVGVEPAIFLLQEAISGSNQANYRDLVSIDLENAFNTVDRASIAASIATYAPTFYKAATWAYNSPSVLLLENGTSIASAKGVRQGDPLGPLFFSLAFRPTLEALAKEIPSATLVAYLDDLYTLNKAQGSLEAAKKVLERSPFRLNLLKSQERPIQDLKSEGICNGWVFQGIN
jgi:hypothetical protein